MKNLAIISLVINIIFFSNFTLAGDIIEFPPQTIDCTLNDGSLSCTGFNKTFLALSGGDSVAGKYYLNTAHTAGNVDPASTPIYQYLNATKDKKIVLQATYSVITANIKDQHWRPQTHMQTIINYVCSSGSANDCSFSYPPQ